MSALPSQRVASAPPAVIVGWEPLPPFNQSDMAMTSLKKLMRAASGVHIDPTAIAAVQHIARCRCRLQVIGIPRTCRKRVAVAAASHKRIEAGAPRGQRVVVPLPALRSDSPVVRDKEPPLPSPERTCRNARPLKSYRQHRRRLPPARWCGLRS